MPPKRLATSRASAAPEAGPRVNKASSVAPAATASASRHAPVVAAIRASTSAASDEGTPAAVVLLPSRALDALRIAPGDLVTVRVASAAAADEKGGDGASCLFATMRDTEQDRLSRSSAPIARFAATTLAQLCDGDDASRSAPPDVIISACPFADVPDALEVSVAVEPPPTGADRAHSHAMLDVSSALLAFERAVPRDSGVASLVFAGMALATTVGARKVRLRVAALRTSDAAGVQSADARALFVRSTTVRVASGASRDEAAVIPEAGARRPEGSRSEHCVVSLLVTGDAGIGKSWRLRRIADATGGTRAVRWVACAGLASLSARERVAFLRAIAVDGTASLEALVFDDVDMLLSDDASVAAFTAMLREVHMERDAARHRDGATASAPPLVLACSAARAESLPQSVLGSADWRVERMQAPASDAARAEILTSMLQRTTRPTRGDDTCETESAAAELDEAVAAATREVASTCHGFHPLDMRVLVDIAWSLACAEPAAGAIAAKHLRQARRHVQPAALRSLNAAPPPPLKWSDIGGSDEAKNELQQCLAFASASARQAFARFGVAPPRGVLLYGPPGCSKTMLAKAVASEGGMNFISVKGPEVFSKWVGDSEKAVRDIFERARAAAPCVVFIDELDGMCGKRGGGGVGDRVIAQLLVELDGRPSAAASSATSDGIVFVAATNRPDCIDEAVLRPGRIDRRVFVGLPALADRAAIAAIALRRIPLQPGLDINALVASRTEGYTGAEVVAVCKRAAENAVHEAADIDAVEQRHFDAALLQVKPRTTAAEIAAYRSWGNNAKSRRGGDRSRVDS